MKKIFAIALCILSASVFSYSQCIPSPGYSCVPTETLNRTNKALDELAVSRDLITKQTELIAKQAIALATSEAKNNAAADVIAKANEILSIDAKVFDAYEKVLTLYQKTVELYATVVEKLTAQLNKPKSAWSKFLDDIKTVVTLAAGVFLGRGL